MCGVGWVGFFRLISFLSHSVLTHSQNTFIPRVTLLSTFLPYSLFDRCNDEQQMRLTSSPLSPSSLYSSTHNQLNHLRRWLIVTIVPFPQDETDCPPSHPTYLRDDVVVPVVTCVCVCLSFCCVDAFGFSTLSSSASRRTDCRAPE